MRTPTPEERALARELQDARELLAALTERLEYLQNANEALYRADYARAGGPRFDKGQPFGLPSYYHPSDPPASPTDFLRRFGGLES